MRELFSLLVLLLQLGKGDLLSTNVGWLDMQSGAEFKGTGMFTFGTIQVSMLKKGSKASFIGPSELRIEVNFVAGVKCGNMAKAAACIFVPGIAPDSTAGRNAAAEYALIEQRKPTKGWQMTVEGGKMCKVSKGVNRPRKTTFRFRCDPNKAVAPEDWPKLAWEGGPQADSQICHYFVEVHSPYGCPTLNSPGTSLPPNQEDTKSQKNAGSNANHHNRQPSPAPAPASAQPLATITAVSGCTDTDPVSVTTGCSAEGGTTLSIHGTYLIEPTRGQKTSVLLRGGVVGGAASSKGLECHPVTWVSAWELKCSLPEGQGSGLAVVVLGASVDFVSGGVELDGAVTYKSSAKTIKASFESFEALGVGGLDNEIKELYRRAFQSRGLPSSTLKGLGIKHTKGVLLYGPPGSGKTLVARTVAKLIGTEKVELVNTPMIMQKFLGESEKVLRKYFEPAEKEFKEKGSKSDVHIIIFDEIDAIFRERGKGDGQAANLAYDSVVNALLTKMDGLEEADNIVVIAMTNRKELLDPALLRPGRFEVQIEIGLPKAEGRRKILAIHTRQMRDSGLVDKDVDFDEVAEMLPRVSGAEIAGMVRNAASFAVDRVMQTDDGASSTDLKVTSADIDRAVAALKPAYDIDESGLQKKHLPYGIIPVLAKQLAEVEGIVEQLLDSKSHPQPALVLLHGAPGTGKTAMAVQVATSAPFNFVKMIDAESLLQRSEQQRVHIISEAFADAQKVESGLIVLDSLERIVELIQAGSRIMFSHRILHVIKTLVGATPRAGSRLMVLATTSESSAILDTVLGVNALFRSHIETPRIKTASAQTVLRFRGLKRLGGGLLSLSPTFQVTIRDLLALADAARFTAEKEAADQKNKNKNKNTAKEMEKNTAKERERSAGGERGERGDAALATVLLTQRQFDELLSKMLVNSGSDRNSTFYEHEPTIGTFEQI